MVGGQPGSQFHKLDFQLQTSEKKRRGPKLDTRLFLF